MVSISTLRQMPGCITRRLLVDVLVVLASVTLVVILYESRAREARRELAVNVTRAAVRMLQAEIDLQTALAERSLVGRAFPASIDPAWFEGECPNNLLVDSDRPWLELAAVGERSLRHPCDPTVEGGKGAMFWYNPALGIVRARVPRMLSDEESAAIYNDVNGTRLIELNGFALVGER